MDRATTCCFTGHRPAKLPWGANEDDPRCAALKNAPHPDNAKLFLDFAVSYDVQQLLQSDFYRHFICGMAQGADMYFGEAVLALREKHPDVTLEAAIPCEEQAARWKERDRNRYFGLVERCDLETMVQHRYTSGCMQRRNRYMVDRSSLVLAVYDGMLGGTMYTLTYAMRQGVRVVTMDLDGTIG